MIRLQSKARRLLDRYLGRVHRALRGCAFVDCAEVKRDVRDHVEMALEGRSQPISPRAMSEVLAELGSPSHWIPGGSTTATVERRRQDWLLAYLSLLLVLLGLALPPFLWIGLSGAFVAARASLCVAEQNQATDTPGQHWLLLPALLVIYVPLVLLGLLWPAIAVRLLADQVLTGGPLAGLVPWELHALAERVAAIRLSSFDPAQTARHALRSGHYLLAPVGVWLCALGFIARGWPAPFAWLLRPVVREGSTRVARSLLQSGLLLLGIALLMGLLKLTMRQAGIA